MRYALWGDGESPHLLKWARALAAQPGLELWAASSRRFLPGFDACVAFERRLALATSPRASGGNLALLSRLPALARWLQRVEPSWVHAHYLSSHGTLAWLAQSWLGVGGKLVGSAWGSDILVAPERSRLMRWATAQVLRHCSLTTSDSQVMARRMRELGAREVMVFPFGLEAMPPAPPPKDPHLFFANRGLEPIYAPQRVIACFAHLAARDPQAKLVVANEGSLKAELQADVVARGLGERVRFVGRLDAAAQAAAYGQALWYLSLPESDSVSVSVLEAMAHGCVPILSDLPANRELVRHGDNGLLLAPDAMPDGERMDRLAASAGSIAERNRAWVAEKAMFGPAVARFVARLRELA